MKKNIIKVLVAVLITFFLLPMVRAEEMCKIYRDYDFFLEVSDKTKYNDEIANAGKYYVKTETYTPAGLSKDAELIDEYQIKIVKDDGSIASTGEWRLNDYWLNYKRIFLNGRTESIETNEGTTNITVYTLENTANYVTRYIVHGKWYDTNTGEWQDSGVKMKDVLETPDGTERTIGNTNGSLNKMSIIPTGSIEGITETGTKIISTKQNGEDLYKVTVHRSSILADIQGKIAAPAIINETTHDEVFFAPAVYYREYNYCTSFDGAEVTISKTIINKNEELPGATLVIKDENGEIAKDIEGNELQWTTEETPKQIHLAAGTYTLSEVSAPEGYELSEKEIVFIVDEYGYVFLDDGKLEDNTIIFENTPKPEQKPTGDSLIYAAWFVGLTAIGFVVFYYIKERKASLEL